MKIAFVSQPRDYIIASGSQRGSVSIVTWELARRLAQHHEVEIYAPRGAGQLAEEQANSVQIHRISGLWRRMYRGLDLASGLLGISPPYFSRSEYFGEYAREVATRLKSNPPDCIHVQVASQFIPVFRSAAPRARIVLHCHDELLTRIDQETVSGRVALAHAVVACSDYVTARWRRTFPAYAEKICTVRNGIDVERFRPAESAQGDWGSSVDERLILYVGRVSPEKGVHVLASAFERVRVSIPDARLAIVGPAGLLPFSHLWLLANDAHVASLREFYGVSILDQLRRQVLEASHSYLDSVLSRLSARSAANVEIVGPVQHDNVPAWYQRARVLAAPSVLAEPFGLPLAEALASGLPVVASRAGGMPEIVEHRVDGLLVERGDIDGLAEALGRLLTDDRMHSEMSKAGLAKAQSQFSWDLSATRLEEVYLAQPGGSCSRSTNAAQFRDLCA